MKSNGYSFVQQSQEGVVSNNYNFFDGQQALLFESGTIVAQNFVKVYFFNSSPQRGPAIHAHVVHGDVAGLLGEQEADGVGDVFGGGDALEGDAQAVVF